MSRGSSKIDFNALKAEASMAHQSGRKMVTIHVDELVSLLVRAEELIKVQSMLPVPVGFCRPGELHALLQGKRFLANLRRKKNDDFSIQMLATYLPDGSQKEVAVVADM
jgi:hypothetical protein